MSNTLCSARTTSRQTTRPVEAAVSQTQRDDVLQWVDDCVDKLRRRFVGNEEAVDLIDSFLTQYDLGIGRLLNRNAICRMRDSVGRVKRFLCPRKNSATAELCLQQAELVVWPFQPSHVAAIQPVYEQLLHAGVTSVVICHNPGTHKHLRSRMGDCVLLDLGHSGATHRTDRVCQAVVAASESVPSISVRGMTVRFSDLLVDCLRTWYGLYKSSCELTRQLIAEVRPKGILVGNDLTLAGRATCLMANREKIATFSIMHGTMDNKAWRHGCSSRFFVFGESDRQRLVDWGVPESRLRVTGSPQLEKARQSAVPARLPRTGYACSVLVALSGPGHKVSRAHHRQIVEAVTNAARGKPEVLFVAKLHKKDRESFYCHFARLANTVIVPYDAPEYPSSIFDWLFSVDALITAASACAIDAIAIGKPAITLDLTGELANISFIAAGATLHCSTTAELREKLTFVEQAEWQGSVERAKAAEYFKCRFANPAGGAAATIADEIRSVVKSVTHR